MRCIILLMFSLMFITSVTSQNRVHRWAVGGSVTATNMEGLFNQKFLRPRNYTLQGKLSFSRWINPSFNARVDYSLGSIWYPLVTDFPERTPGIYENKLFQEAFFTIEYKLNNGYIFRPKSVVQPYFLAGIGFNSIGNNIYGFFPWGGGLKFRCTSFLNVNVETQYKIALKNSFDYLQHSIGLQFCFGKTKKATTEDDVERYRKSRVKNFDDKKLGIENMKGDSDADSVPDNTDECPYAKGLVSLKGCPDTDGDMIPDHKDECPDLAGSIENMGCPPKQELTIAIIKEVLDTDGDGVLDNDDACPNDKGDTKNYGCPDRDNDGVSDPNDACPDEKGVVALKGCPEVKQVVEIQEEIVQKVITNSENEIFFRLNGKEIDTDAKKILEQIFEFCKTNNYTELVISGYSGKYETIEKGIAISMERAVLVSKELEKLGIPAVKMRTLGYGQFNNKYPFNIAEEAKKNERVFIEIK